MVLYCIVPSCSEPMRKGHAVSFHHLPHKDSERCKQWLRAINHPKYGDDVDTATLTWQRVCSFHFKPDDFEPNVLGMKKKALKDTAVPSVFTTHSVQEDRPAGTSNTSPGVKRNRLDLRDTGPVMDRPPDQIRSTGIQEDAHETITVTMEKPALQYIVDKEAILQLMQDCPMCDKKIRCTQKTHGPYFIVYQSCSYCHYQRKWASQPEARYMNTNKRYKSPTDKLSVNGKTKTNPSQLEEKSTSEPSESKEPLET